MALYWIVETDWPGTACRLPLAATTEVVGPSPSIDTRVHLCMSCEGIWALDTVAFLCSPLCGSFGARGVL